MSLLSRVKFLNYKHEAQLSPEKEEQEDSCSTTITTDGSPCKGKSISPSSSSGDFDSYAGSTTEGEQGLPGSPESASSSTSSVDAGQPETRDNGNDRMNHRAISDADSQDSESSVEDSDSEYDSDEEYESWFEELDLGCAQESEADSDDEEEMDTDRVKLESGAEIGLAAPEIEVPLRYRTGPDPEAEWYRNAVKQARRPPSKPWKFKLKPRSPQPSSPKGELSIGSGPIFLYLQRRQQEGADVLAGPVEIP